MEALEVLVNRLGRPEFAGLVVRYRDLLPAIAGRTRLLRERVWW